MVDPSNASTIVERSARDGCRQNAGRDRHRLRVQRRVPARTQGDGQLAGGDDGGRITLARFEVAPAAEGGDDRVGAHREVNVRRGVTVRVERSYAVQRSVDQEADRRGDAARQLWSGPDARDD